MIVRRKKLKRKIKKKWNEAQQKVIDYNEGALLVSSPAGSGKTAVIIERIKRLLQEKRVAPQNLLATTFTRKAAKEMDSRLSKIGVDTSRMSVQTFHSFCYQLLKKTPEYKEWKVDDKDKVTYILKHILGYKVMDWKGHDLSLVKQFIASQRNQLISPENSEHDDYRYVKAYFNYDSVIHEKSLLTFDDMIYFTVRLLQENEKLRKRFQNKIQYLIVDEFQDVNKAQVELCDILAYPDFNFMSVGDISQAIYKFRGSIPEYMLEFIDRYNADLINLEYNYRCPPNVFNQAFTCVKNNKVRIDSDAKPFKQIEKPIEYNFYTDSIDQACGISEKIKELTSEGGINYKDVFILLRTNAQTRPFEEVFSHDKIPFVVSSSYGFYDRREIKALICYLRLAFDKNDYTSGEFIINRPFRFIARKYIDEILHDCGEHNINFLESCSKFAMKNGYLGSKIDQFVNVIDDIGNFTPNEAMKWIVERTKYFDWLNKEFGSDEMDNSKVDSINELIGSSSRFNTIQKFLDHVDEQIMNMKKNKMKKNTNSVHIMTYHRVKGLENKVIFLPDANEGIIPHKNAIDIEEERRIWYVGMTRAEDNLYVSSTASNGMVSRFLKESNIKINVDTEKTET